METLLNLFLWTHLWQISQLQLHYILQYGGIYRWTILSASLCLCHFVPYPYHYLSNGFVCNSSVIYSLIHGCFSMGWLMAEGMSRLGLPANLMERKLWWALLSVTAVRREIYIRFQTILMVPK